MKNSKLGKSKKYLLLLSFILYLFLDRPPITFDAPSLINISLTPRPLLKRVVFDQKESQLVLSHWNGRTGLVEDPTDPEYYLAYKFSTKDDPDGSILRYEQRMLERIAPFEDLVGRPQLIQGVHPFKGQIQNPPIEVSPQKFVLVYRAKKKSFISLGSKLPSDIPDKYSVIKQASLKNLADYIYLIYLLKKDSIHTSLTPLSHYVADDGRRRLWRWYYKDIGGIEEISKIAENSNLRLTGLMDYEHLWDNEFGDSRPWRLGQALCEWSIVVTYSGIINRLKNDQISDILLSGYQYLFTLLEVKNDLVPEQPTHKNYIARKFLLSYLNTIIKLSAPKEEIRLRLNKLDVLYEKYGVSIMNEEVSRFIALFRKDLPTDEVSAQYDGGRPTLDYLVHVVEKIVDRLKESDWLQPKQIKEIHMGGPTAIAVAIDEQENMIVVDNANKRFLKLDQKGKVTLAFGSYGSQPEELGDLKSIATDLEGNIYLLVHGENHYIQKFDTQGNFILSFGHRGDQPGELHAPSSIALDPKGNIYVADTQNHRIQKFDKEGNFLFTFGQHGSQPGEFKDPRAITTDNEGNIYVADSLNHRIQKFDQQGNFILEFGKYGSRVDQFENPRSIAISKNGNIYVVEVDSYLIQEFDQNGTFIRAFGNFGNQLGQFRNPPSITTDKNGNIYVTDSSYRIQKFIPSEASLVPIERAKEMAEVNL